MAADEQSCALNGGSGVRRRELLDVPHNGWLGRGFVRSQRDGVHSRRHAPNHIAAGFPSTAAMCASCHPITTWADGKFDHSTTGFPLTGAHADPTKAPCSACHVNNNYSGNLPTDCYSCHTAAWQSTVTLGGNVPNHIAAGFPTTCATCHTTTSWLGATFDHSPYWRLPHQGAVCSDCHIDSINYANTSCINCHTQSAHSKTSTDNNHQGISGYSYGPMTCIKSGCHTKGP